MNLKVAWEIRKGKKYYYQKVRVGDKVVSRYLGSGPGASLVETETQKRLFTRENLKQESLEWENFENYLRDRKTAIETILNGLGVHNPNSGPWRKKRNR